VFISLARASADFYINHYELKIHIQNQETWILFAGSYLHGVDLGLGNYVCINSKKNIFIKKQSIYKTGVPMNEIKKKHTGRCIDCGGTLELVELDVRKSTRNLRCQRCGLVHNYKKDIWGGWKLLKATK
jgi:DNA-directed RNA polymerase subunit RPC12/RpoP